MREKTITNNWELNYKCEECGMGYYNMSDEIYRCEECGSKNLTEVNPLHSRAAKIKPKLSTKPWSSIKRKSRK